MVRLSKIEQANKACTGLVGTVRVFEHFQRPEQFSARRVSQRPAHKPSNANRWAAQAKQIVLGKPNS